MRNRLRGSIGVALVPLAVLVPLAGLGACDAQVEPEYAGEPLVTLKGRVEALQASPPEADIGVLWFQSDAQRGCSGPVRSEFATTTGSYSPDADYECAAACGEAPGFYSGETREEIARQQQEQQQLDDATRQQQLRDWESCQRACGVDVSAELSIEYQPCVTGAVGQTAPVVGDFPAQFSLDMLLPPPARALMPSDTGERVALGFFVALAPHQGSLAVSFDEEAPAWLMGGSETHVLAYAADPIDASSSWGSYLGGAYDVGYHLMRVHYGTRCGLPEFDGESVFDSEGDDDGADYLMPMPDTEPLAAPQGSSSSVPVPDGDAGDVQSEPLPDYRDDPFVCGNGICEAGEDCRHCSDCASCEGGGPGQSSGVLYGQAGYSCLSTQSTLVEAASGDEADIQLLLASPDRIDWPYL